MKYLSFWTITDLEKAEAVMRKTMEISKENPGTYSKSLSKLYMIAGTNTGVNILEGTPEQVANDMVYWEGCMDMEYVPLIEWDKYVEALREKRKREA
ncbi:MAG: hypothetical protein NWE75_00875 [Candidatus Bathyarchaeota archaeon]|nr:hypothetical protein [Candidatus Bathyarchaeota archaeon]